VIKLSYGILVIYYQKKEPISGGVKINFTQREEELKALLGEVKDVHRPEKLQALYWLKSKTVKTVLSVGVFLLERSYPACKDGCLAIVKEESQNYYPINLVRQYQEQLIINALKIR
jgi:hypothetical protein